MAGFQIFMHALRMVFGNIGAALRVTGPLYAISFALTFFASFFLMPEPSSDLSIGVVLAGLVSSILFVWMAVAWHRYILLGEMPAGLVPPFGGRRLIAYVGYSLVIGVILVPIGLVGFLVLYLLLGSPNAGAVMGIGIAILMIVLFIAFYRLAVMLPGAAVERRVGLGEAWAKTRGATGAIVVVGVLSTIGAMLLFLPVLIFVAIPGGWILVAAWQVLVSWIEALIGVTILTTLYGHYVEGRPLGNTGGVAQVSP